MLFRITPHLEDIQRRDLLREVALWWIRQPHRLLVEVVAKGRAEFMKSCSQMYDPKFTRSELKDLYATIRRHVLRRSTDSSWADKHA